MSEPTPEVPRHLADFEVIRRLGAGGMAEVFLAKKRGAERTYKLLVVKRILPQHISSRRFRTMFAEEAQLATRLNHPNIVQVYDFQDSGEEGQLLSMEYVEGPDLRKLQRAGRTKSQRIPPYVAAYIAAEVAKGLHYAHERRDEKGHPLDIVHRDVSPQNILLSFDGAVKIADFGIATANLFREEEGVLKGKTGYMSPEQARGEKVDRRTDIYSLGVVLHETLTGRPLHGNADGDDLLQAVRGGHVEPPSTFATSVPPEVEAIVMKALAKDPDERFQTARDFAAAITRALFQKQQLVDSHVLEGVILDFVSREHTSPGLNVPDDESDAGAGSQDGSQHDDSAAVVPNGEQKPLTRRLRERVGREVRHVAVVMVRLHHLRELAQAIGENQVRRFSEQLRTTLSEIAFKRGAHLAWNKEDAPSGALTARAVVGLMANPTRAAADAAWLAVDIHEAIQGAAVDLPITLAASVGIVRGIASGRRDDAGHLVRHVLHKPANELADLLGEHATSGQTWVAGGLYRLVRRDFIWRDAPTIEISDADRRNLPRNLRVHVLDRPLSREEKLAQMSHTPRDLIGRDSELAELHAAYHRCIAHRSDGQLGRDIPRGNVTGRVVVGEMGIGKTALVDAFVSELPEKTQVIRIECSPARRELPFSHIGAWLRELTGIRLDTPYEEARGTIILALGEPQSSTRADEIVRRMTELSIGRVAEAFDEADVAHYRRILTSGVRRFFGRSAVRHPLVVVIDGIQWADLQSLELITLLARRSDPSPVLVVLLARPDDRIAPLIEGIVRLELKGLSSDNQLRLIQAHLGATKGVAQVCTELIPRAAGNPFFLLEMVDTLLERGALDLREDENGEQTLLRVERVGKADEPLPSTLEQLIADRLNELPQAEHGIIDWLAVSGGPLAMRDLRVLSGPEAEEHVARLCARGLCDTRGETVDVRHPLTRDVAYLSLERQDRVRMHQRLGGHLSQSPIAVGLSAAIVARHFARGGDSTSAAEYYLRAAVSARQSYQLELASRYFRRTLAMLPETDLRRLDAFEALENMCRIQGRWRERRRYLMALRRTAQAVARPRWVAVALIRSARLDLDEGRLSRGLGLAQQGEQMARLAASPTLEVEAQSLMAEMLRELGDMQGALAACDRALDTASQSSASLRLMAEVLRARGTLLLRVGRVQEAVNAHAEAIAVFRRTGARRLEARAKNSLASAMFVRGHFSDAIALALEAIRIDLSIGGRFQIARTLSIIGQSYARLGDADRAEAYLQRARDAHQRYGDQDGRADTLLASAEIAIEKGDFANAELMIGDAAALSAVTGSAYDSVHEKLLRALLARTRGQPSGAVMYAFDARQVAEAQAYVAFHFYAMAIEALARVEIGEQHTGILLATTALGAIETIQGSEFGLETRALCCEALERAGSPQASELRQNAARYPQKILEQVRDPELREKFSRRPAVKSLMRLDSLPSPPAVSS